MLADFDRQLLREDFLDFPRDGIRVLVEHNTSRSVWSCRFTCVVVPLA